MEQEYKNIFYFYNINSIGGVESFFYYLAKKYSDYDITVFYTIGDARQIKRLRQYVRVKKYTGGRIKCSKAFFNYSASIINNVDAEEYIQIIHADYKTQGIKPNLHPKITKYVGVSKHVCKTFEELTGKECELIYNPIEIDKPKKILKLISATRLTPEKGKDRIIRLGNLLNQLGIPYMWLIFTNDIDAIDNPNIIYMKPSLDITNYMQEADFLVQLSSCEAYCFSVIESLILGKPVIVTDLPVYKELGLDDSNSIRLDLNFTEISKNKLLKEYKFKYEPPKDTWDEILEKGNSNYKEEIKGTTQVKCTTLYDDIYFNRRIRRDEIFTVDKIRAMELIDIGVVKEIENDKERNIS